MALGSFLVQIAISLLKGLATSLALGAIALLISFASVLSPLLGVLNVPFAAFAFAGMPLAYLLELLPFTERILVAVYPEGGASGVFAFMLFCAIITWSVFFAVLWHKRHYRSRV